MKILKEQLKVWAKEIRVLKGQRKGSPNGFVRGLDGLRSTYRDHHIAYCELRGRKREEIEQPARFNTPYEKNICKIKAEVEARIKENFDEAVCSR